MGYLATGETHPFVMPTRGRPGAFLEIKGLVGKAVWTRAQETQELGATKEVQSKLVLPKLKN